MNDLMTAEEVKGFLRVSAATVNRLADKGELPCVWIAGARRFRNAEVQTFLANATSVSPRKKKVATE